MLRNKKVIAILSIIISIATWIYVMGSVDPKITRSVLGIDVTTSGEEYLEKQNLKVSLENPETVDIKIKGKRSEVCKAIKAGITAEVDVSHCEYGENKGEIKIKMPGRTGGVSVVKVSEETATFRVR